MKIAVPGRPISKGSKRVVRGRVIEMMDATLRDWRSNITASAVEQGAWVMEGALAVRLDFFFTRPKGHFGTGRNAGILKPSAPARPAVQPDIDKLARACLDSLSGIAFRDDAQVVDLVLAKHYASDGPPGVTIEIEEVDDGTRSGTAADRQVP